MTANDAAVGREKRHEEEQMDALKGKKVFIRTVTSYYTGKVKAITKDYILLDTAAWIADTGRFSDAMKMGLFSEVEPYAQPVYVMRGAIVDVCVVTWALPTVQI